MNQALRQRWDMDLDAPKVGGISQSAEYKCYLQAIEAPIPEYRAKLVTLVDGQYEISVTPTNKESVINARMGFNPLLDRSKREKSPEERLEADIENRKRAAKRARQKVRYLVKNIHADHLLTFSYRENVENREKVGVDWQEFVRLFRVRYPEWQYISVSERQERGSIHLHVAVKGRQDIRWLLRCWLVAIGQLIDDVSDWLIRDVKLGNKSMGAVNVVAPNKRWGGGSGKWKSTKLSGYLTKYIGKEFEEADKFAKKYWHSKNIVKPIIERFWLKGQNWRDAVEEAYNVLVFRGVSSFELWGNSIDNVAWLTGEVSKEHYGKITQCVSDLDGDLAFAALEYPVE